MFSKFYTKNDTPLLPLFLELLLDDKNQFYDSENYW